MKRIHFVYIGNIFFGFHYYLTVYVNSSFLLQFVDQHFLDWIYIFGAISNIALLLLMPKILASAHPKGLTVAIIALEFVAVLGLSIVKTPLLAILFFVLQQALGPIILYCLDLFLEASIKNESHTGRARAIFLTAINITLIASFGAISLFAENSFSPFYFLSSMMLIPLSYLIISKFDNEMKKGVGIRLRDVLHFINKDRDILRILISNTVLQFFYSLMVIYLPLLLHMKIGFSWEEIGLMLMMMILPFIIFEYPVGRLIDKHTGEKEFLALGFIIMSAACFTLTLTHEKSFWLWASILFTSRIGAALVEISCESYFFKKVTERNPSIISLFRITQPLSMALAPAVALPALIFTDYSGLFAILGSICILGLAFMPKIDTK